MYSNAEAHSGNLYPSVEQVRFMDSQSESRSLIQEQGPKLDEIVKSAHSLGGITSPASSGAVLQDESN